MSKRPHASILSSTLSSLSNTNESTRAAKKATIQTLQITAGRGQTIEVGSKSVAPDRAITDFLQNMRTLIHEKGIGATIEIELRFGHITSILQEARCRPSHEGQDAAIPLIDDQMKSSGAKFVPGIHVNDFPAYEREIKNMLRREEASQHLEKQVVHSMDKSRRIIEDVDISTGLRLPPQIQVKERLGSLDIFLPQCPYDCRVSISCEFPLRPLDEGTSLATLPPAESIRHKDRTSILLGREARLDLTKVEDNHSNIIAHEFEIELHNDVVQYWLQQPDDNAKSWRAAYSNASQLWKLVKRLMPSAGQAFKRSWDFEAAQDIHNAYETPLNVVGKFPGTMPVGFARWHIPLVREKERKYHVSEKTDGVRYFLVIAKGEAVLVDRSNMPYTTSGLDLLPSVLPDGTVLDGEFVFHQKLHIYMFMVFDIIATGPTPSDSHVDKTFAERLWILNNFLSEEGPYSAGISTHQINWHSILPILRKKWVPVHQITEVFKLIKEVTRTKDKSLARIYSDGGRREHMTDGIIFCPNTHYIPNTHDEYLKWKWSDLITIDFLATLTPEHQVSLSCGGPRGNSIELDSTVVLDKRDKQIVANLLHRSPSKSMVLEFAFDADAGVWHYKCARPDKDVGNYIRTVLGSLMNMAEAISEEELQYRIAGRSEWNKRMKAMRRSILENTSK